MDVSVMLTDLNAHGFSSVDPTHQLRMLNDTYQEVCMREPWPFLEKEKNLAFTGSSSFPTAGSFPTDFQAVLALVRNQDPQVGVVFVPNVDIQKNILFYQQASSATYYTLSYNGITQALGISVYGTPLSSETLNLEYLAKPVDLQSSDLSASILLPAKHHRVLVLGTLAKLYWMRDRGKQAQSYDQMFEHRIQMMRNDLWRQQYDRSDYIKHVDDDTDDWGWGW